MPVVKHASKPMASDRVGGRSGHEINVKLAIVAGEGHGIHKRLPVTSLGVHACKQTITTLRRITVAGFVIFPVLQFRTASLK